MQLELIHLCTTMIQYAGTLFVSHRKELIQFAWGLLKYDNVGLKVRRGGGRKGVPGFGGGGGGAASRARLPSSPNRALVPPHLQPYAFLCVSRFFAAFPTPEKIMLQVVFATTLLLQAI